jgi:hypothetical protein
VSPPLQHNKDELSSSFIHAAAASAATAATTTTTVASADVTVTPHSSSHVGMTTTTTTTVGIFWDYQTVQVPYWYTSSIATVTDRIRNKVALFGRIVQQRLYYDARQPAPPIDLDPNGGFTFVDDSFDEKFIVDVLSFAHDHLKTAAAAASPTTATDTTSPPPPTTTTTTSTSTNHKVGVVLIASDGDYSCTLARLHDLGVFTIVIYKLSNNVQETVAFENANVVMSWEVDVLGGSPSNHHPPQLLVQTTTTTSDNYIPNPVPTVSGVVPPPPPSPPRVVVAGDSWNDGTENSSVPLLEQGLSIQMRNNFAALCESILGNQMPYYSDWASESQVIEAFDHLVGKKELLIVRGVCAWADQTGLIEWGRQHLTTPGFPVIKIKNRQYTTDDDFSTELYLRLTPYGLAVFQKLRDNTTSTTTTTTPTATDNMLDSTVSRLYQSSSSSSSSSRSSKRNHPEMSSGTTHKRVKTIIEDDRRTARNTTYNEVNIHISCLTPTMSNNSLLSYFGQFGQITKIYRSRKGLWARIQFFHPSAAQKVLVMMGPHIVDTMSVMYVTHSFFATMCFCVIAWDPFFFSFFLIVVLVLVCSYLQGETMDRQAAWLDDVSWFFCFAFFPAARYNSKSKCEECMSRYQH